MSESTQADYGHIAAHFQEVMTAVLAELDAVRTTQDHLDVVPRAAEMLQDAVWYGEHHLPMVTGYRGAA